MSTEYSADIVAWAQEQAELLRAGKLSTIDIDHIAEEIEDVGKSDQRELAFRMALLLAHLPKWQCQAERRGTSWQRTIKEQQRAISAHIKETPSLRASLSNANWREGVWADAVTKAISETGLDALPEDCPWSVQGVLAPDFYPA